MIDTVLILQHPINEADARNFGKKGNHGVQDMGPGGIINAYDWRVWSGSGFGRRLQNSLNAGNGYAFEVSDMGQYVSVRASYHCHGTGKTISKTFIIAFDDPKWGDGKIFATSTKWRTISNVDQAASYINQAIRSYTGAATSGN